MPYWPDDLDKRSPKTETPSTPAMVPVNGQTLVKFFEVEPLAVVDDQAIRTPGKAIQGLLRFLVRTPLIPLRIYGMLAEEGQMFWNDAMSWELARQNPKDADKWVITVLCESACAVVGIPFVGVYRAYQEAESIRKFIRAKAQAVADVVFGKEPL